VHSDPRGSIVSVANFQGYSIATNTYDEYGIPDTASGDDIATKGRFRYTGQAWIPELGMYYYKARIYSPTIGRFLQTDPIGYDDGMNMYAYVGNDPINGVDPTGLYGGLSCMTCTEIWSAYSSVKVDRSESASSISDRFSELNSGDFSSEKEGAVAGKVAKGNAGLLAEYSMARAVAAIMVEAAENKAEAGYFIYERGDGSFFTKFRYGVDGNMGDIKESDFDDRPDGKLRVFGHAHNTPYAPGRPPSAFARRILGAPDTSYKGPSDMDVISAKTIGGRVTFVLHQRKFGKNTWESSVYGR
jgi:RHS repeat-associated protein